jgi:membrane protein implicated in regulation of membrane protease activity
MLKPTLTLAALGVVGFFLWKVLGAVLLPMVATVVAFLVKIAVVVALMVFLLWFFRKNDEGKEGGEAPAE